MSAFHHRLVLVLAIVLALAAGALQVRGVVIAWNADGGWDLNKRAREYRLFSERIYPNDRIASNMQPGERFARSLYPPYAFPLFAPFFAFGYGAPARIVFDVLNFAALALIGLFGYTQLRAWGRSAALLGATAGLAIVHNSSAVALGQFAIISAGFVAMQLMILRQRPVVAGLCWMVAMIKPQIALSYAPLFLHERCRWRGLGVAIVSLALLSWFACIYTSVSPWAVLEMWFVQEEYRFGEWQGNVGSSAWGVLMALGLSPRIALGWSLFAGTVLCLWSLMRMRRSDPPLLVAAGVCAILGRVFVYHRTYDDIMLFPALLAFLVMAFERPSAMRIAMAVMMGASVWLPISALARSVWVDTAMIGAWLFAGGYLLSVGLRPREATPRYDIRVLRAPG